MRAPWLGLLLALPACADDAWPSAASGGSAGSGGEPNDAAADAATPLACPSRVVSTLAGASAGFKEGSAGPNGIARLDGVRGVAAFSTVLSFVADRNNHRVRSLLFDGGDCEVWAGSGLEGFADGEAEQARLAAPEGVAVDGSGTLHFADTANHAVRRVVAGEVVTLAGDGSAGFADGSTPRFDHPTGIAVDATGVVYVADRDNHAVRKLTPAGVVSTLAGDGSPGFADGSGGNARFASPWGIALDPSGTLWVADTGNHRVRRVAQDGSVTTFAGGDGSLDTPTGIAVDGAGKLYVADSGHFRVVRYSESGSLEVLAGGGSAGFADGPAASAAFSELWGLAVSIAYAGGGLLVGDAHRVRLVHCP